MILFLALCSPFSTFTFERKHLRSTCGRSVLNKYLRAFDLFPPVGHPKMVVNSNGFHQKWPKHSGFLVNRIYFINCPDIYIRWFNLRDLEWFRESLEVINYVWIGSLKDISQKGHQQNCQAIYDCIYLCQMSAIFGELFLVKFHTFYTQKGRSNDPGKNIYIYTYCITSLATSTFVFTLLSKDKKNELLGVSRSYNESV